MINFSDDKKIWVISDTHFFHANILKYSNRPFNTIEKMNDYIISEWDCHVSNDDYVIFVGDLVMGVGDQKDKVASMIDEYLPGKKIYVRGNHDMNVTSIPMVDDLTISYKGKTIYFNHFPNKDFDTDFYIHGHTHNKRLVHTGRPNVFNVSVEACRYKPLLLSELIDGSNKYLKEDMNAYTIYQDMDGCLTDFKEAVNKLGSSINELNTNPNKVWGMIDNAGANFWSDMPWTNDGKELWEYVKQYNVEILSSPSKDQSSRAGKYTWCAKELGNLKVNLTYRNHKPHYAGPNEILIDDLKSTVDKWIENGGIGILHTSASDTIKQLKELGL